MIGRIFIIAALMAAAPPVSAASFAWGGYAGYIPSMGGTLGSKVQDDMDFNTGINGINRTKSGFATVKIDRLFGACGGAEAKTILGDYFMLRGALNFAMGVYGGEGKTLDPSDNIVKVKYSLWTIDIPFAAGVCLPFQKDAIVYLCGGFAAAYGSYTNSFRSSAVNSKGVFRGFAAPALVVLGGEYFIGERTAILAQINWYHGATAVIRSGKDAAPVDFGGYRFLVGASYYTAYTIAVKIPEDDAR